MSLEILDDDVKRKFVGSGGSLGGKSVHEFAGQQLLYTTVQHDTGLKDENGEPILEEIVNVDGRTELPSPANTTVLQYYANHLDNQFGKGRGNGIRVVDERYRINMISKERKGRFEFASVAIASAMNNTGSSDNDLLKQVQKT